MKKTKGWEVLARDAVKRKAGLTFYIRMRLSSVLYAVAERVNPDVLLTDIQVGMTKETRDRAIAAIVDARDRAVRFGRG